MLAELAGTLGAGKATAGSGSEIPTGMSPIATRSERATGGYSADDLLGAVDLLGSAGRSLSDALAGLDADSGAASHLLQEAAHDFSVRHDLGEVLNSAAEEFMRIAAEQAGQATTDTTAVERLLERFTAVYTMAREREVHAESGGPRVQVPDQPIEPDLADVLF